MIALSCPYGEEENSGDSETTRSNPDSVALLAIAQAGLIYDAALRSEMGLKSRAVFDNHATLDTMLDRYQAVLQQVAGTLRTEIPIPLRRAA